MLSAPSRSGRRHNLTSLLLKRHSDPSVVSSTPSSPPIADFRHQSKAGGKDGHTGLASAVTAKIEDGNLKAAIRIITSGDQPATDNPETLQALHERHPAAAPDRHQVQDPSVFSVARFSEADVVAAIRSFPAGSTGGPDGLRPQHLRDLISNRETGAPLLSSLTTLVNCLFEGKCPPTVCPIFFGGRLIALQKKSGGIRPIAIGYTLRRLAAKCANRHAITLLGDSLLPLQLGVGASGGCEAAIHSTRRFLAQLPSDHVLVKLDFVNAFNCVRRDAVLAAVASTVPDIYRFCSLAYHHTSILQFGQHIILSQEGVQQGDPLGPLLFCLAVHPLLSSLNSHLTIGYLDDFTLGGSSSVVAADVASIIDRGTSLGLSLNRSKCEIISHPLGATNQPEFQGFRHVPQESATLLGAPLSEGPAMDDALTALHDSLQLAVHRLALLSSHDALVLLKNSLGGPKLQHVLRTSPCCNHPSLPQFDATLRSAITQICNVTLSDHQWAQASLPVRHGGLGIRSVSTLAPSAFLASAAGTHTLQELILRNCHVAREDISTSLASWVSLSRSQAPPDLQNCSQRSLDSAITTTAHQSVLDAQANSVNRARILATAAAHSGDWLHALPISACGLRLSDEAVRVAVGLRLGVELCQAHQCPCGATVDTHGLHVLSCKRSAARAQRHHYINDLIWRALSRAGIPSVKEPHGLVRSDGKRPDGLTLIPWRTGRCATWDVTVTDTVAPSYLSIASRDAASVAEAAAQRKVDKYAAISQTYLFFPLAFETLGPINQAGQAFISELGRRISVLTDDPRETSFLFQRLSVALQRFNAACLSLSFVHDHIDSAARPKYT